MVSRAPPDDTYMSATASDLPLEVWCNIGQYVLPADRPNLALVNSTLYGIVISDLFTHVEVVSRNPTPFVYAFQTLKSVTNIPSNLWCFFNITIVVNGTSQSDCES